MRLSGKTPLLRARSLEKELNVKKIYIKMEGANPTHHKYSRVAEILCKDATAHKMDVIVVDGTNAYIRAVEYFADRFNLKIIIPQFKNERWKGYRFNKKNIVDFRDQNKNKKDEILQKFAFSNRYYLAMEGFTNQHVSLLALEEIPQEIIERKPTIDSIYTQFSYGYTINSLYSVFLKQWIEDEKRIPKIYCGIDQFNKLSDKSVGHDIISYMQSNKSLLNASKEALKESFGKAIVVDEDLLKKAKFLLMNKEHIKISTENAYPLAAFLQQVKNNEIKEGNHIILLNDARSKINIIQLSEIIKYNEEEILHITNNYLAEYSDPLIEMKDAVQNARKKGFILIAEQNEEYVGVCIIVNTQFDDFIPTYHLAYIGTDKTMKGRGVGSELIKRAIDITNGNLSLHVDLDNNKAKKLYEKMGFKHVYNRMIYYG